MTKSILFISIFFLFSNTNCFSQKEKLTSKENNYRKTFIEFKNYLNNCINNKVDITDAVQLQFLLKHYVFINVKQDTSISKDYILSKLNNCQLNTLKKTLNVFDQFLLENQDKKLSENLDALPIRLTQNTFIYDQLTNFQKENTLVFFDKRNPKRYLGFLLFIPPTKDINPIPKIWSWNLGFNFGKYLFTSVIGEEGYEYIFSSKR